MFDGNNDSDSVVYNKLTPAVTALVLRLLPVDWQNHISMRMEIYGCPGILQFLVRHVQWPHIHLFIHFDI